MISVTTPIITTTATNIVSSHTVIPATTATVAACNAVEGKLLKLELSEEEKQEERLKALRLPTDDLLIEEARVCAFSKFN